MRDRDDYIYKLYGKETWNKQENLLLESADGMHVEHITHIGIYKSREKSREKKESNFH